ncbi:MAG: hypothetical protein ICV69_15660 [Thermoleophilaceae bacterium]|nr:hypothetical protein [Thermoleophilaceae bacterium]
MVEALLHALIIDDAALDIDLAGRHVDRSLDRDYRVVVGGGLRNGGLNSASPF